MAARMDPVIIRRKIAEVESTIATMKRQGETPETIHIEERKLMVLRKWLEQPEDKSE